MRSAAVLIPTTGSAEVKAAIQSCLAQTYPCKVVVVVDGPQSEPAFRTAVAGIDLGRLSVVVLPENVGKGGFYGHRIYAAFTHLVNDDYVLYLDQDNWFGEDHLSSMVTTIESSNFDWCYSLRQIADKTGPILLRDDCESLGRWPAFTNTHLVDTSAYCLKTEVASRLASVWHGGWGTDRIFFRAVAQAFPRFGCTGKYTLNYRLEGNSKSVTKEFFEEGNALMKKRYPEGFPWAAAARRLAPLARI